LVEQGHPHSRPLGEELDVLPLANNISGGVDSTTKKKFTQQRLNTIKTKELVQLPLHCWFEHGFHHGHR